MEGCHLGFTGNKSGLSAPFLDQFVTALSSISRDLQHSYLAAHLWLCVQLHYTFAYFIFRATGREAQLEHEMCSWRRHIVKYNAHSSGFFITCVCVS